MQFFVDNAQTILALAVAIVGYIYHIVAQRVPAERRKYVEQWAGIAVAMVEQQYADKTNKEKKTIAMDEVKNFFKAFNLPLPPDDILSSFIEASVNALSTPITPKPPIDPPLARRASLG